MNHADRHPALSGPGMMFFSAALFGYFGFLMFSSYHVQNQIVPLWAMITWTLRGAAVGCGLAGLLTLVRPLPGNLVYSIVGLLAALGCATIAVWDVLDTSPYVSPGMLFLPGPVLFSLFAAWIGFGSWQGLKTVLALRAMRSKSRETADFPASR